MSTIVAEQTSTAVTQGIRVTVRSVYLPQQSSPRESRSIIYAADYGGIRALIAFMVQDCCKGRPETCAPLIDAALAPAAARCCPPSPILTEH